MNIGKRQYFKASEMANARELCLKIILFRVNHVSKLFDSSRHIKDIMFNPLIFAFCEKLVLAHEQ